MFAFGLQVTPADLDSISPGPDLALALAGVDREQLSGHDRVALLKARARQLAHDQAELCADIQSVADAVAGEWDGDPEMTFHTASSEVQVALCLTRRAGEAMVDLAEQLVLRLPAVWRALHEGSIDLARARIICDLTSHLPADLARDLAAEALTRAPGQTTGQLRARLQRLMISLDPGAARERYESRLEERRVHCRPAEDGTAHLLGLHLPPEQANAAMRRINRLARGAKARGDRRRIDQIRADLFLQILTGRLDAAGEDQRGVVDLKVDLTTLAGLDDNPAEIPGWGPVIADIARQVAETHPGSEWRVIVTDGDHRPIDVVTTRRRPTPAQRRQVEAASPTCVFPRCRMPAAECDLNHEVPWVEGHRTTARELGPLCRHHHVSHHQRGWNLERICPGAYRWTSPLGHTYEVGPEPP